MPPGVTTARSGGQFQDRPGTGTVTLQIHNRALQTPALCAGVCVPRQEVLVDLPPASSTLRIWPKAALAEIRLVPAIAAAPTNARRLRSSGRLCAVSDTVSVARLSAPMPSPDAVPVSSVAISPLLLQNDKLYVSVSVALPSISPLTTDDAKYEPGSPLHVTESPTFLFSTIS